MSISKCAKSSRYCSLRGSFVASETKFARVTVGGAGTAKGPATAGAAAPGTAAGPAAAG